MVSLVSIIINLFKKNRMIQIFRLPTTRVLRAHQLGLALAAILSLLVLFLNARPVFTSAPWFSLPVLVLIIALGTYWGGLFVLLTGLFSLILFLFHIHPTGFMEALSMAARAYIGGYAFGVIVAILYNDLVYLWLHIFDQKQIKLVFAYDPTRAINIIKSPKPGDELALKKLFEKRPGLKERRLYQFNNPEPDDRNPYTIAFVANPWVLKKKAAQDDYETHRSHAKNYYRDPIIDNQDLFLKSVERALYSFERNEVLGRPEIWSKIRILTIFDPALANKPGPDYACLQEFQGEASIAGQVVDNLLDPMEQMEAVVKKMLDEYDQGSIPKKISIKDIDVIFGLSATPTHDRSTAHYSSWIESADDGPDWNRDGVPFQFDPDPIAEHPKGDEIRVNKCTPCDKTSAKSGFICQHEYYAEHPGRVALNVIGARNKSFIHEFAHAMSSAYRGAITDEYADQMNIKDNTAEGPQLAQFYVNRIERRPSTDNLIPVHAVFARYNGVLYLSDLAHPSAEENWLGYFPERYHRQAGCIMDRTMGQYEFDRLISAFMYDRLVAKINRP